LIIVSQLGNNGLLLYLISNRADVHSVDVDGYGPLHWASKYGHTDCVKSLLKAGCDPNLKANGKHAYGRTPLHMAAYNGKYDIVELLVKAGADLNSVAEGDYRVTPLHQAIEMGQTKVITLLCESTALDVNVLDANNQTPLHYSIKNGVPHYMVLIMNHASFRKQVYKVQALKLIRPYQNFDKVNRILDFFEN